MPSSYWRLNSKEYLIWKPKERNITAALVLVLYDAAPKTVVICDWARLDWAVASSKRPNIGPLRQSHTRTQREDILKLCERPWWWSLRKLVHYYCHWSQASSTLVAQLPSRVNYPENAESRFQRDLHSRQVERYWFHVATQFTMKSIKITIIDQSAYQNQVRRQNYMKYRLHYKY